MASSHSHTASMGALPFTPGALAQRAPKFHQLQISSGTKFRRHYPSRAKYGEYDTKSIQNRLIWALKWLIYTLFELKSVKIRG